MVHVNFRKCVTVGAISCCLAGMVSIAQAGIVVDASVGGAPAGMNYANFDNLSLGSGGGVSGGITVSFTGDGQTVQGSQPNVYAALPL